MFSARTKLCITVIPSSARGQADKKDASAEVLPSPLSRRWEDKSFGEDIRHQKHDAAQVRRTTMSVE